MPAKKKVSPRHLKQINDALEAIIDQWYLSVSDYYVTAEKKAENPALEAPEELKRFHDENGHRIKFSKRDLDFTFGLSLLSEGDSCAIEASVNNKVPEFNYDELIRRLSAYYQGTRDRPVEDFKKLKKPVLQSQVFCLPSDLQHSVRVEQREGKADIVRLAFEIQEQYMEDLVAEPSPFMDFIHEYCVAPLRRIYADVYRTKRQR